MAKLEKKIRWSYKVRVWDTGDVTDTKETKPSSSSPNPSGDDDEHAYVDIRRSARIRQKAGKGRHYQETFYNANWPNGGKEHDPSREIEIKTIKPPDGSDYHGEVPLPIIKSMTLKTNYGLGTKRNQFLRKRIKFDNSGNNDNRKVQVITLTKFARGDGTSDAAGLPFKIEIIKSWGALSARGFISQDMRFNAIWRGEPDKLPKK